MSSTATPGVETPAGRENRDQAATVAIQSESQSAIPGLSHDVVIANVLGSIKDPTDLAWLRAVSRAMHDAIAATGHRVKEVRVEYAVGLGYLSTLKHLHQHHCLVLSKVLPREAAKKGQLEVLQWLRENGCPRDLGTCWCAAQGGHLEVLQWARAKSCPWDEDTCNWAAKGGHLEILQWARANGCPWNQTTCWTAAMHGHLEVLRCARANDCPWGSLTCIDAKKLGHIELLNWAIANGCPQQ